jgi:hypothetical protein
MESPKRSQERMMSRQAYMAGLVIIFVVAIAIPSLQSQQGQGGFAGWTTPAAQATSNDAALMSTVFMPDGTQQLILVDTTIKSIAVYHVAPNSGVITLRSVRRVDADFSLDEYNGADPTPEKIRAILPH